MRGCRRKTMKNLIYSFGAMVASLLFFAGPVSAQTYYDMTAMADKSGFRSVVYETVTDADFLRAPAYGFMRFGMTRGSDLAVEVFACETKTYDADTCNSLGTHAAWIDTTSNSE